MILHGFLIGVGIIAVGFLIGFVIGGRDQYVTRAASGFLVTIALAPVLGLVGLIMSIAAKTRRNLGIGLLLSAGVGTMATAGLCIALMSGVGN